MLDKITIPLTIVLFIVLGLFYFYYPNPQELDKIFLTISTFLFSVFTGFFISRQANRYAKTREVVAGLDGRFTSIYRMLGHINIEAQKRAGEILKNHYGKIFESKQWNYHLNNKSETLASLHKILDEFVGDEKILNLKNQALGSVIKSLSTAQDLRKHLVALQQERIPTFQWTLIYLFTGILLFTVSSIPSFELFLGSILKAAFAVSVISIITILHKLDHFKTFGDIIGYRSGHDVLKIINGQS